MNNNFYIDKNTAQWIVDELWMNAIKKQNAPISRQYLTLITPSQGRYLTLKINYFSVKVKVIVVIVLVSWVLINVNCKYYVIRSNKKSTETSVYWIKIQTLGVFTVTLYIILRTYSALVSWAIKHLNMSQFLEIKTNQYSWQTFTQPSHQYT